MCFFSLIYNKVIFLLIKCEVVTLPNTNKIANGEFYSWKSIYYDLAPKSE